MRYLIVVIILILNFQITLLSQETLSDTLFFNDGRVEAVNITGFDENSIKYTYPNEGIPITTSNTKISKVITRNGRVVTIETTAKVKSVFSAEDWEKVDITGIESEVEGLIRIANVSGKAEGATEFSSLEKMQSRSMTKMRMQAAFWGCDVVFILNQTNTPLQSGLWTTTTATSTLSGTAYAVSLEIPKESINGDYILNKAYRLRPNDFELKKYNVSTLNRNLKITVDDFFIDDDHYTLKFNAGIKNSGNKMHLLKASDKELVFLVIDRSKQSKLKYYNLYFYRK